MYSMALGPRCLKWKMCLSGPKALLFLQLLIALLIRSVVVVVVCPLQPSSSVNPGCPGPESSVTVSY